MSNVTPKVYAERRQKWVDKLTSGLPQSGGALRTKMGYCCLGLACEVYQEDVGDLSVIYDSGKCLYIYDGETAILPPKVRDYFGLKDRHGSYVDDTTINAIMERQTNGEFGCLSEANDNGVSFETIAVRVKTDKNLYVEETV